MNDIYNRAQIIDQNFTNWVRSEKLPKATKSLTPKSAGLDRETCLDLFESQLISRHLDLQSRLLKQKNLSYYTIGSSGHEGNVVLGKVFDHQNMAFLHYRSGALMVQRSKHLPRINPIRDSLLGFVASADDPIAGGRHKVFGSLPLLVPPQTSTIASHLPKAMGAAFSMALAKDLKTHSTLKPGSAIICNFGDASLNHSTAQGAINTAQWISHKHIPLPILFICEDNGLGISVETPSTWVESMFKNRQDIHYIQGDGLHLADAYRAAIEAQNYLKHKKKPVFLHLRTIRLMGHAGSDIEMNYRSLPQIEATEAQDPLLHTARILREANYCSTQEILDLYEEVRNRVQQEAQEVIKRPKLTSAQQVMDTIIPKSNRPHLPQQPTEDTRKQAFGKDYKKLSQPGTLAGLMNLGLIDILQRYQHAIVFGEDVAVKGGVYHITAGLSERFGMRRVFNSLLDEQSILGMAMGCALNGFLPIPEIQFLAYLHNAEDQLRGEAATLPFFSNGQYTNPMVLRIASLAYQKGFGGHFHNDNSFAVLRDIPGLIIACPSNGADAVKMFRTCVAVAHAQGRISAFLEPIALYPVRDLHEEGDGGWLFDYPDPEEVIHLGEFGVEGDSDELVILSYGNGYYLSKQAAKILETQHNIVPKLIDLRWISPINDKALMREIRSAKRVLVVDECRQTGSWSEGLVTMMVEHLDPLPKIRRLTGHDSFIPLGDGWKYILPDTERIVQASVELSKAA